MLIYWAKRKRRAGSGIHVAPLSLFFFVLLSFFCDPGPPPALADRHDRLMRVGVAGGHGLRVARELLEAVTLIPVAVAAEILVIALDGAPDREPVGPELSLVVGRADGERKPRLHRAAALRAVAEPGDECAVVARAVVAAAAFLRILQHGFFVFVFSG